MFEEKISLKSIYVKGCDMIFNSNNENLAECEEEARLKQIRKTHNGPEMRYFVIGLTICNDVKII